MKALFADNGAVSFEKDYPPPVCQEGEALIRVLKAGICNTDLEILKGYMDFTGVLGHEFVGLVEEAHNKRLIGKRVVGEINCGCGNCPWCARGIKTHCPHRTVLGILKHDGAFAEYLTLPEENLHELSPKIKDEEAVFVEPLAAAFRITEQVSIIPDDRVVILGDGKLGLLVAQVLALTGCKLLVVGKHPEKLEILSHRRISTALEGLLKERDFDCVVDCTGSPKGLETALGMVRPQGRIILKSTFSLPVNLCTNSFVVNEVSLIGSRCGPFPKAITALESGKVDVIPLISKTFKIDEGVKAIDFAAKKGVLKVILDIC